MKSMRANENAKRISKDEDSWDEETPGPERIESEECMKPVQTFRGKAVKASWDLVSKLWSTNEFEK